MQTIGEKLFFGGLWLWGLCLLASIVLFLMAFTKKDKDKALWLFKWGAGLFFTFLLLLVVGFGLCLANLKNSTWH